MGMSVDTETASAPQKRMIDMNTPGLFTPSVGYRPFRYPWCYDAWLTQRRIHWQHDEVPLGDDVKDWNGRITPAEKSLLTNIFRFFTQADVEVSDNYVNRYLNLFKPTEVVMMLTAFAESETCHIAAYSHLLDTVGMPEVEYQAFLSYKEMKDKSDYMKNFKADSPREIAKSLAAFGAFTEGLQLFASFVMLLNFSRFGLMRGMGQQISYSIRDETLHCNNIIRLYHTFCAEHPGLCDATLKAEITQICRDIVEHEDAFVDLAFQAGEVRGMTAAEIKKYIRYTADKRLLQLGLDTIYNERENPLPWVDALLNSVAHESFFETRATEYSKSATRGDWSDAF
jgi:ribonucleoside-diphosphate reductase beta chain